MTKDLQLHRPPRLVIEKSELLKVMKANEVAEVLGITKQAISGWGEIIPELRAHKLIEVNNSIPHRFI